MYRPLTTVEELESIRPEAVTALLANDGWRLVNREADTFERWALDSPDGHYRLLLPLDRSFDDFSVRLNEAVNVIAEAYGAERWRTLLGELIAPLVDVFRFRCIRDTLHGSIPWEQGIHLFEGTREAMSAAAKASQSKSAHFGRKNSHVASRYLQSVRMGQTEASSFVVTVLAPLQSERSPQTASLDSEAFEAEFTRRISASLMISLSAAAHVVPIFQETGDFSAVSDSIGDGVSADLLESIVKIVEDGSDLAVTASWAPQALPRTPLPSEVLFSRNYTPTLSAIAEKLKETETLQGFQLTGRVSALSRATDFGPGVATLTASRGYEVNKVRMRLSAEQYDLAIQAHRAGTLVTVVGDLERNGNLFWLENISLFEAGQLF